MDDFALVGIVFLFLVVLGKEPFPALVGSGSDCGLTVAALDDFYIMVWTWQARFLLSPRCWGKKEQGTCQKISCSVVPPVGGGYLVLKVRVKLARCGMAE